MSSIQNKIWRLIRPVALALLLVTHADCSHQSPNRTLQSWDAIDSPLVFPGSVRTRFSELPLSAQRETVPWGGWSWKTFQGRSAFRWQTGTPVWGYTPPSREKALAMARSETALLSPAEKWDIFLGRFDYPTVNQEREQSSPQAPRWFGLCHGWAVSALLLQEPHPTSLTSPDGITIPFGSADVKAILAYYLGEVLRAQIFIAGRRCGGGDGPECHDVNAGAFHLILTNRVGIRKEDLIIETDPGLVVWNRPVAGYQSRMVSRRSGASAGATPGTVQEITMETRVSFGHRANPQWEAGPEATVEWETYRYRLELNDSGSVVGGEWEGDQRPDTLWMRDSEPFRGAPPELERLYRASVGLPPIESIGSGASCPAGTQLKEIPYADGARYCEGEGQVPGPITSGMRARCIDIQGDDLCQTSPWPEAFYLQWRGGERCPEGTVPDDLINACVDSSLAYGPFDSDQIRACRAARVNFSCDLLAWPRAEATRFLRL